MAEVKWVKLTTDMFDNRKIRHLRRLPEGNNIVLIWVMLLTMAGRCNSGGRIFLTENIPYTPRMLADELDFEENTVIHALQAFEQLDMIVTDNGFFTIAGWEEYQNADKLAEIRAKDRERKRLKRVQAKDLLAESTKTHGNPRNVHGMSTDCPHIEEDGNKEKEIRSFTHPADPEERERLKMTFLGGELGGGVVLLNQEQFEDLLDNLSIDEFNKYVSIVRDCELQGKSYKKKSHYQAILDMAEEDRRIRGMGGTL